MSAGDDDRDDLAASPEDLRPFFPGLEIVELVGQGGMAAVYKARELASNRWVALKVLSPRLCADPAFAERFSREAEALGVLSHPGIVTVLGSGRAGEHRYLILEYVEGANLRQAFARGIAIPAALAALRDVCGALAHAHGQGLVHRDIKPENILINTRGRAKVADFGLARLARTGSDEYRLTRTRDVMGTPHYMAPEQVSSPRDVDHRADIYAVGVVLYEALTGELPLGNFDPPSKRAVVDPRLDSIALRALENDPAKRYASAGEMQAALESVLAGPAPLTEPELAIGEVLAGRYRIDRPLGRGATATAFEALDARTGERVAVKQLRLWHDRDWKDLELFEREARVLAGLSHPSIPRFIESIQADTDHGPRFCLVREIVPGESLADRTQRGFWIDEAEACRIAADLLSVLIHLHGLSPPVVHRDIKPGNIVRRSDGHLYLIDFGAVRRPDSAGEGSTVVGTYGYMAPEQFRGSAGPSSDLYSLAATLVYLLSAREPDKLPQRGLRIDFRGAVNVSPDFADWLERMLEPDPRERFASAQQALAALHKPSLARPIRRRVKRAAALGLALGAVIASAAATVVYLQRSNEPPVAAPRPEQRDTGKYVFPVTAIKSPWGMVFSLAFDSKARHVAGASRTGTLALWERETGAHVRSFTGHQGEAMSLALSADDSTLVASTESGIGIWSTATGEMSRMLTGHQGRTTAVAVTPDARRIVSGGFDGTARVWDGASGTQLHALRHDGGRVLSVAITRDGRVVASGGDSGAIRLWDTESGKLLRTIEAHGKAVNDMAFSTDGVTLVTASDDRSAAAWLVSSGRNMRTFPNHYDEVWAIALSPDGSKLITGEKADVIRIWDVHQGRETQRQPAHLSGVVDVKISEDGQWFAVAGGAREIKIWRMPGTVWRPPLPPSDYQPPPLSEETPPKTNAEKRALEADALLEKIGSRPGAGQQAVALADQAIAADPNSALAYAVRARAEFKAAYVNGSEYDPAGLERALSFADRAIALDPMLARAYVTKGHVHQGRKSPGDARRMLEKAESLAPDHPRTLALRGDLARDEGRTEEAIESARKIIETSKDARWLYSAYSILGSVYRKMRELPAAEDTHIARMRLAPDSAWARGNYASFLVECGEHDRAIALAKSALAIMDYGVGRKILADAHAAKARQLASKNHFDEAGEQIALATKAFSRSPEVEYAAAFVLRARALAERRLPLLDQAKAHLEKALVLDPTHAGAKAALADQPALADKITRGR